MIREEAPITEDYVTPGGKVIPVVYQRLRNRINKVGIGVGTQIAESDTAWDVYMNWFTPEEARQFIVDCDNVYGSVQDKIANMMTVRSVIHVQPVSRDVIEGDLVPWTDWEAHIDEHDVFCVMPCQCRQKVETLTGDRACKDEHPIMTCTTCGEMAEYLIEIGVGTPLTREEARAQIQSNVDHGLVIEGTISKQGGTLCACHSDCCLFMGAVLSSKGGIPFVKYMSDYDLNYKADECLQCGACATRCPLKAIEIGEDGVPVTQAWCVRCGQCGLTCPAHARTLVPRPIYDTFEMPDDLVMDHAELSMTRYLQGIMQDFTGQAE